MIFPAIDLMGGGCVRLVKGDFNARTNYAAAPIEVAQSFADAGAQFLHIVDLDGAKNQHAQQSDLIMQIARAVRMKIQTGGGLRSLKQIKTLLDGGLDRVVIGSLAVKDPALVKSCMKDVGADKIVIAIDVFIGDDGTPRPAVHGWTQTSDLSLWQVINSYSGTGLQTILVTDIAKDGGLKGANIGLYQDIMQRYPKLDLITSGGVGSLDDILKLKALNPAGIIVGKALYENKFTLEEAIKC